MDSTDDLVARLRDTGFCGVATQREAADEIERLRAAGDALALAYRALGGSDALPLWEKARGLTPHHIDRNDPAWKDTHRGLRFP